MKEITLSRWTEVEKVSRETWKELISSLVLSGYEVYADEDKVVFTLGNEDSIEETEKE